MTQEQRDIKRKLAVLPCAEGCGNVALTAVDFARYHALLRGLPVNATVSSGVDFCGAVHQRSAGARHGATLAERARAEGWSYEAYPVAVLSEEVSTGRCTLSAGMHRLCSSAVGRPWTTS